jgi:hypothetical protein
MFAFPVTLALLTVNAPMLVATPMVGVAAEAHTAKADIANISRRNGGNFIEPPTPLLYYKAYVV